MSAETTLVAFEPKETRTDELAVAIALFLADGEKARPNLVRELPELYPSIDATKMSQPKDGAPPTRTVFQQNLDRGMQYLDHVGWGYKPSRGVWALTRRGLDALELFDDDRALYREIIRLRDIRQRRGLESSQELEEHWRRVGKPKSQPEADLVRAFERWYGRGLRFEFPIPGPATCMYADIVTPEGHLLEAKAASDPVTVGQAMGQALTYIDYAKEDLRPFVLLPQKPDDRDVDRCRRFGVDAIWQVGDAFFGALTPRSDDTRKSGG